MKQNNINTLEKSYKEILIVIVNNKNHNEVKKKTKIVHSSMY